MTLKDVDGVAARGEMKTCVCIRHQGDELDGSVGDQSDRINCFLDAGASIQ